MTREVGRHVYGAAAVIAGTLMLCWRDAGTLEQLAGLGNPTFREAAVYAAGATALVGGVAMQWRRTSQLGAVMLGALYLVLAVSVLRHIVAAPLVYNSWGNFFEQFSYVAGALIAYASGASNRPPWAVRATGIGRVLFGICVVSFALEQAFYLPATAGSVPKWVPPGPMFWAMTTTAAFALAGIAMMSGRQALLASRLLVTMLLLFGLLIWIPALVANPRSHFNWSESVENLAIAGAAWILADSLRNRPRRSSAR